MTEQNTTSNEWEDQASQKFSAERKEDFLVLILAAITVVVVWTGLVDQQVFKWVFF